MGKLFRDIDALLRGRFTRREDLLAGRIDVPVATLVRAGLLLGAAYGVFMGLFAVIGSLNQPTHFFREDAWSNAYVIVWRQIVAFLTG